MKILHMDLREGRVKLQAETLDDLWYLRSILEEGDFVEGVSFRRIRDEEKKRADKGERVKVYLRIRVKKTEFAPYASVLRVTGVIEEGPEDLVSFGSHHTIEIKPGSVITVIKEWKKWHLERLKEAEASSRAPTLLIAVVDDVEAEIGIVRRYGVDICASFHTSGSGKHYKTKGTEFYSDVARKISELFEREKPYAVIVAGPGFWKEKVYEILKQKFPDVAKKSFVESTGSSGRAGIYEVLKRGIAGKIARECRLAQEAEIVEKLMAEIGKESGYAAYGYREVERALDMGAVDTMLVEESFLRENPKADKLIEKAKTTRARVVILSSEHEAGERVASLGKIAALLRFPLEITS